MKISCILLPFLFLAACKQTKHSKEQQHAALKTGVYVSAKYGITDRITLATGGYTNRITGMELTINKDSSFKLKTCSAIETGNWQYESDSLYLFVSTIRWKNDSLQQYGFEGRWLEVPKKPEVFSVMNGNILKEDIHRKDGHTSLNMLVLRH